MNQLTQDEESEAYAVASADLRKLSRELAEMNHRITAVLPTVSLIDSDPTLLATARTLSNKVAAGMQIAHDLSRDLFREAGR